MPPTATAPPPKPEPKPAPVAVVKPEPKPAPVLVASPAPSTSRFSSTPIYKKWWLWTIVGVVVVGGAVGAGVAVGVSRTPASHFGDRTITF